MIGHAEWKVLVTLSIQILLLGVSAIQNDPTSSRSSQEDMILSGSAYTGPERTSNAFHRDKSPTFQRTAPAFQLESSKSMNNYDKEEVRFEVRNTRHEDESIDELTSSKHVDHIDGNNIEVKPGEYYHISPTTSESMSGEGQGAPQEAKLLSEPHQLAGVSNQQAQYLQAIDQQRRARQEIPRIYSEHAPPPILQTASPGRQANPDIQDIITGIVKLLNGNVNVAANTVRPLRPIQATRINNRGPPRISDVPPLPPDFDTPGMNPPPPPDHPYPFEKPPAPDRPLINQLPPERPIRPFVNGVPLPEQIVPQGNRPWTWNRPGGNRRPIPPYKPLPPATDSSVLNREKEQGDKNSSKHKLESKPEPSTEEGTTKKEENDQSEAITHHDNIENATKRYEENNGQKVKTESNVTEKATSENSTRRAPESEYSTTKKENKHQAASKENASVTESSSGEKSKTNFTKHEDPPKSVIPLETPAIKPTKSSKIGNSQGSSSSNEKVNKANISKTSTKSYSTSTLNIETSSSIQIIESTTTKSTVPQSTPSANDDDSIRNVTSSTISLQPSKSAELEGTSIATSVPTENLPSLTFATKASSSSSSSVEKSIAHIPSTTNTFSKNSAPADRYAYRPRPGIVLDDTLDYTGTQGLATQRPYAPPRHPPLGDIFDVTVSAVQGPGGGSSEGVRVPVNGGNSDVILTSAVEGQGFVSIDGKRTYLNLFENSDRTSTHVQPQPQPTEFIRIGSRLHSQIRQRQLLGPVGLFEGRRFTEGRLNLR